MSEEFWVSAADKAVRERNELSARRERLVAEVAEIDQRILQLEQAIDTLINLVNVPSLSPAQTPEVTNLKLADACREILKSYDKYMNAVEVRDALQMAGYDLGVFNNALASIHGVLKRLVESGDVLSVADLTGTALYKWNTSVFKHSPLKWINQRPDKKDAEPVIDPFVGEGSAQSFTELANDNFPKGQKSFKEEATHGIRPRGGRSQPRGQQRPDIKLEPREKKKE